MKYLCALDPDPTCRTVPPRDQWHPITADTPEAAAARFFARRPGRSHVLVTDAADYHGGPERLG